MDQGDDSQTRKIQYFSKWETKNFTSSQIAKAQKLNIYKCLNIWDWTVSVDI